MGLDMYLKRQTYIGSWVKEKAKPLDEDKLREIVGDEVFEQIKYVGDISKVNSLEATAAYWRKCNAIHNWFINNGYGEDEHRTYIPPEKLKELYELCVRLRKELKTKKGFVKNGVSFQEGVSVQNYDEGEIITNPELAEELLPTTSGFFFGSTEYDNYYLEQLDETIEQLGELFKDENWEKCDYYYEASW